jgi:hypothetical protein
MPFARPKRILRLDRLRLRGPNGAREEFHLAATAQNLRKLAKLVPIPAQSGGQRGSASFRREEQDRIRSGFFNTMGGERSFAAPRMKGRFAN